MVAERQKRTRGLRRWLCAVLVLASACTAPPPTPGPNSGTDIAPASDARALLEAAREAAIATRAVRYRFEFGTSKAPSTWATGETWMLQRAGLGDSLIRVEGRLRTWDEAPAPFRYSTDGTTTWAIDPVTRTAQVRAVGDGDRFLGGNAVYGYLTEFIERQPYWKELGQADSLRALDPASVGDVACHVIEARYHTGTPQETRHLWYLAEHDHLPRGLRWFDPSTPGGGTFWLYDVRPTHLQPEDFTFEIPAGYALTDARAPAEEAASPPPGAWSLTSWRGDTVSSTSLRGKVVVLDFWNTWCFICRALQPQMGTLAARYLGDEGPSEAAVAFYGVNVFEIDDANPDAYWTETGHPYDYLEDGDAVAQLYDVPWQPGVVVLGKDGKVLFSLVGGTGDRIELIEHAIEEGLGATPDFDR